MGCNQIYDGDKDNAEQRIIKDIKNDGGPGKIPGNAQVFLAGDNSERR